jgi:hypothetical protein
MNVTVTTDGSAAGRINRDAAGRPVRAAMGADGDGVRAAIVASLRRGAPRPEPFTLIGTIDATWDGTTCRVEGMSAGAGLVRIDFHNRSSTPASLLAAGVRQPKTWANALEYIGALDLSAGEPVIPDWLVPVEGTGGSAEAGEDGTALATLPSGLVGLACASGVWPDLTFSDGGSFTLTE